MMPPSETSCLAVVSIRCRSAVRDFEWWIPAISRRVLRWHLLRREQAVSPLPRETMDIVGPDVLTGGAIAGIWTGLWTGRFIMQVMI